MSVTPWFLRPSPSAAAIGELEVAAVDTYPASASAQYGGFIACTRCSWQPCRYPYRRGLPKNLIRMLRTG